MYRGLSTGAQRCRHRRPQQGQPPLPAPTLLLAAPPARQEGSCAEMGSRALLCCYPPAELGWMCLCPVTARCPTLTPCLSVEVLGEERGHQHAFLAGCSSPHLRQCPLAPGGPGPLTVLGLERPNRCRPSGGHGPCSRRGTRDGLEGAEGGGQPRRSGCRRAAIPLQHELWPGVGGDDPCPPPR